MVRLPIKSKQSKMSPSLASRAFFGSQLDTAMMAERSERAFILVHRHIVHIMIFGLEI
jgi:hypothetical protein